MFKTSVIKYSNRRINIGVIGAGQMGIGISFISAKNHKVTVIDSNEKKLRKGSEFIDVLLKKDLLKGKIDENEAQIVKRNLTFSSDLKGLKNSQFCIEVWLTFLILGTILFLSQAIVENLTAKQSLIKQLDEIVSKDCILATNTSSISITKIASASANPQNVIGMHFMNPVPVMKLVEIITGLQTSSETLARTLDLSKDLGKITTTSKDVPGFIANRILMPYINEACFVLQEGIATKEDIDNTMKLGTNTPMGPLVLADFIGLDTCLAIMRVLHTQLGDSKYRPSPLLIQYVDAGYLGKKSGRGFYSYE